MSSMLRTALLVTTAVTAAVTLGGCPAPAPTVTADMAEDPDLVSPDTTLPLAPIDGSVTPTFTSLYATYFTYCSTCHGPTAPARTSATEQTLDFTTAMTAYTTITTGTASGLQTTYAACNGAPFIVVGSPQTSLLVAAIDYPTRLAFANAKAPHCALANLGDMEVMTGLAPPTGFLTALEQSINAGTPNN